MNVHHVKRGKDEKFSNRKRRARRKLLCALCVLLFKGICLIRVNPRPSAVNSGFGCVLPLRSVPPIPLWGQHNTQVTNAQPLATIRIFLHFSIDIHTYQLYNCSRYGKERMEGCGKEERGMPLNCRSQIAHCG
jgi:hypothetical protein